MKMFYGNYRGIIKSVLDGGMGQCRIYVPGVYPVEFETKVQSLPIAEPALPLMNGNFNSMENKDVDDLTQLEEVNLDVPATGAAPELLEEFKITDKDSAERTKKALIQCIPSRHPDGNNSSSNESVPPPDHIPKYIVDLYWKYFKGLSKTQLINKFESMFKEFYPVSENAPSFDIGTSLGIDLAGFAGGIVPMDLENSATGAISYPTKGTRVWVFFEGGDPNYPIYFAATHGGDSFIPATVGEIVNHTKSVKITINEQDFVNPEDLEVALDENGDPIVNLRQAHLPIKKYNTPSWDRTLWKPINDAMNGMVFMLESMYLSEYENDLWAACVVSKNPWGDPVLPGGMGRIVAPYEGHRPTVRFDVLGKSFGSSKVYCVILYRDGRRQPWEIPQPGMRIEQNSISIQKTAVTAEVEGEDGEKEDASPSELGEMDQTTPEFASLIAGLGAQVAGLPAALALLRGLDIKYSCDATGMATLDISFNGMLSLNINGAITMMHAGDSITLRAGSTNMISNGTLMEAHANGGFSYP